MTSWLVTSVVRDVIADDVATAAPFWRLCDCWIGDRHAPATHNPASGATVFLSIAGPLWRGPACPPPLIRVADGDDADEKFASGDDDDETVGLVLFRFFFLSRRDGSAPNGRRIGHIWAGQSPTTEDGPLTFEIHPLVSRRHEEALLQDRDPHRPGPEGVQGRLVRPEPGRQGLSSGKAALGHCRGHHCRRFVLLFLCLSSNSTRTTFS